MATVIAGGVFVGLVYGLLAVGLVVTYRGSRVVNFAYGETGMIGTFAFSELWVGARWPVGLAVLVAVGLSAVVGAATELAVVRPLRGQPPLSAMVGTLAVASLLLAFAGRRWGVAPQYLDPVVAGDGVALAGLRVQPGQLLILAVAVLVVIGLAALYRTHGFGLRLRATAMDPEAAGLVGVNTQATSIATWALAGGLAGLSGILIAPTVGFSVFFMTSLLLRSLAAALVGGLTSIGGAFVAGISLGVAEGLISYLAPITGLVEVALAVGVIALLLIRPSGLVRSAY